MRAAQSLVLFSLFTNALSIVKPINQTIDDSAGPQWAALLRIDHSQKQIKDAKFYLSRDQTLKSEWEQVKQSYFDSKLYCRFPARFLFVGEKLKLPSLDFSMCSELSDFLNRAPMDRLELVFASENLTQASSIMGHTFLKISGKNAKGIAVEHALSFYTDIRDLNFLKLIFESLITGKKGYFTLAPYADVKGVYLFSEQRNLWEYEIKLNDFDRKLLALHLFELKNIEFKYFFHSYNCSTFVFDYLSVAYPQLQFERGLWVSPLDVVRAVSKLALVAKTRIVSSSKWRVRALEQDTRPSYRVRRQIADSSITNLVLDNLPDEKRFLTYELARAANSYRYEIGAIGKASWRMREDGLARNQSAILPEGEVDISNFKMPDRTLPDSSLSVGFHREDHREALTLGFLPAAHWLISDAGEYLSEYELIMLAPTISYQFKPQKIGLDSLTVYSVQAYAPSNALISTWSGKLQIGYDELFSEDLQPRHGFYLRGGLGKTYRPINDVDFYGVMNGGAHSAVGGFYLQPEIGAFIRQIFSMKTQISVSVYWLPHNKSNYYRQYSLSHSIPLWSKLLDFNLNFKLVQGSKTSFSYGGAGVNYYF